METILVIDTETTGLSPIDSGIVEFAAVAVSGGKIVGEFSTLVWPGREALKPRNREALKIRGITLDMVIDAPEMGDAANQFMVHIRQQGLSLPFVVTSYNVAFDRLFLDAWMTGWLAWTDCLMLRAMDVMGAAGALIERYDGTWKYPRLSEAAIFFDVPCLDTHRALGDARAAARIYLEMERRCEGAG